MKGLGDGNDLLSVDEVGGYLGVGRATVWRWCREGRLPALKVGKHWRVRREALEEFLRERERSATLVGQLGSFLRVPDNVLAIAQDLDVLHRLDAAFFGVGEARGGLLVKFHGGEDTSEDELRSDFRRNGLEVERLEREGRFLMRSEGAAPEGREGLLGRLVEDEAGGGRTIWASFDWTLEVTLEAALEQQERLAGLVDAGRLVVKTAALAAVSDGWSAADLWRARSPNAGTIIAFDSGFSMSRTTPMPSS